MTESSYVLMDHTPIVWIIQQFMMDRAYPGHPNLAEAALAAGHHTYVVQMDDPLPVFFPCCIVTYGTHQFVRKVNRHYGSDNGSYAPVSYSRIEKLSYSAYAPYIGDLLLNDDFVLLPFGEFERRGLKAFGNEVFIKPNAVTKAFTGLTINEDNWDIEIATLKQVQHIDPELMVVVASPKQIKAEFRFVIADGKVVTGSEYRWDNVLDIRSDVFPECLEVAQEVASRRWQSDTVYVCDIALTEDGKSRVVELNSFSSSGLYACDTRKIIEAVSRSAANENRGYVP